MTSSEIATLAVTTLAAVIVAWQSFETRRSANAAQRALTVANESVGLNRSSLELTRKEESNTRILITEAVRTRIDSASPRMTLTLDEAPVWPPFEPLVASNDEPQLLTPIAKVFRMPRDKDERLIVRQFFLLRNDSAQAMSITMPRWRPLGPNSRWQSGVHQLPPGSSSRGMFDFEESISYWVEKVNYAQTGLTQVSEQIFTFQYNDNADCGVTDTIHIEMWGTPLWPVSGEDGAYQVVDSPTGTYDSYVGLSFITKPLIRTYWLSRSGSVELS
jgi:hypothetical protein